MQTQRLTEQAADRIIASRLIVDEPGTYETSVTHVNTDYRKIHKSGAKQVGIISFAAMTEYHDEAAETLMAQGDYDEAANQKMTLSVFESEDSETNFPVQGQAVEITVIRKTTANGVNGLFIKSWCPAPKKEGRRKSAEERRAARYAKVNSGVDVLKANASEQGVPAFMK